MFDSRIEGVMFLVVGFGFMWVSYQVAFSGNFWGITVLGLMGMALSIPFALIGIKRLLK